MLFPDHHWICLWYDTLVAYCCRSVLSDFLIVDSFFFTGVVTLRNNHTVCEQGNVLSPEQARILVN